MDATQLKDEQYRQLLATIRRHQRFYNRLIERMNRVGFPGTDDVYLAALRAQDAVQALAVNVHYASCKSGVGRAKQD